MERKPQSVKDVPAAEFIAAYAAYLKRTDKLKIPVWVDYVKTGKNKELAPYDKDWLYIRAASIARKIYLRPNLGVKTLRKLYGGSQNNGTAPSHYVTASGKLLRYLVDQLEKLKIVELDHSEKVRGKTGGRRITRHGQQELDSIARQLAGSA